MTFLPKSKGRIGNISIPGRGCGMRLSSRWGLRSKSAGSWNSRLQYYTFRSMSPDHARSSYALKNSNPSRVPAFARTSRPGLRTPRLEMTIQRDFARLIPTLRRLLVNRKPMWLDNDWVWVCESRKITNDASAPIRVAMRRAS